jgi:hypothetical protein
MNEETNEHRHQPQDSAEHPERAEARISSFLDVDCQVLHPGTGEWLIAGIRDLSSWGACLLLAERFEVGQVLTVQLLRPERGFRRTLSVEVRHAEIIAPNDAWLHGCKFAEALDEDEVRALL